MSKKSQSFSFSSIIDQINTSVFSINQSKFFAGIIMILINIGSKFITIKFSKSCEMYIQQIVNKQLLVFAMAWLGTRDIYTAFLLSSFFILASDYLFNEESVMCVVPTKYRVLHTLIDTDEDGSLSDTEVAAAVAILEKARRDKVKLQQKQAVATFKIADPNVLVMS